MEVRSAAIPWALAASKGNGFPFPNHGERAGNSSLGEDWCDWLG
jgi:hypothetical protein